jgi:putative iron-only hydrogenase system regulator
VKGAAIDITAWVSMGVLLPHRISDAVFFIFEVLCMETRVAVMSVIVEEPDSVERLNGILHEFGQWIIGRMGIPYRKRGVSIISIALDAPQNTISSLAGKIGSLPGVSVKTAYSGVIGQE